MSTRDIRRRCRELLRTLDVQPPLDVAALCHHIGERRGKPIRLVPHPIPVPGPFGVWISTTKAEYILFQDETSKLHQDHIVLHELGHILAGHQSDEVDDALMAELYPGTKPDTLRQQYPDIGPDAVRRALRRSCYDSDNEREAEVVATTILEWASVVDAVSIARPVANTTTARVDQALTDSLGWL
ncbi:hypothetical protein [Amycolatopsis sp. NPDC059021]|uniref:hypothetical protein n=1 Tax=Amycolatopsis sp. NPDC059021 TaxID=3346704 RepID=UPI00366A6C7F